MTWLRRERGYDGVLEYENGTDLFTIEMCHGGHFMSLDGETMEYSDFTVDYFDGCELDQMSFMELMTMAKEIGHKGNLYFYWSRSDKSVKLIVDDSDVLEMCVIQMRIG